MHPFNPKYSKYSVVTSWGTAAVGCVCVWGQSGLHGKPSLILNPPPPPTLKKKKRRGWGIEKRQRILAKEQPGGETQGQRASLMDQSGGLETASGLGIPLLVNTARQWCTQWERNRLSAAWRMTLNS